MAGQAEAGLSLAKEPQRDGLPAAVSRDLMTGQRLPQAVKRRRAAIEGGVAAPEPVESVTGPVRVFDLGKCAAGLLQIFNGFFGAIKIQQDITEIDQRNSFAEALSRSRSQS